MAYGVTPEGFVLKRLPEIKSDIENDLIDVFGEVDTSPSSVFGQLTGVLAKPAADVWEGLEQTYHAAYPASAEGAALDNVLDMNGLQRKSPTRTIVTAILEGTEGTTVLEDKQAKTDTDIIFALLEDTTITKSQVLKAIVEVTEYQEGEGYTITIDGDDSYTIGLEDEDVNAIADRLKDAINVIDNGVTATRENGIITIIADDHTTAFSIDVSDTYDGGDIISLNERWTPATFRAVNAGKNVCIAHSLNEIVTPQVGWNSIDNLEPGQTGQDIESDAEARIRRAQSLKIIGASVLDAIVARINNDVADVNNVVGYQNYTDETVDGRPPHSFEIIVEGGDENAIAQKIWDVKPAGIQTCSTAEGAQKKSIDITDSNGDLQTVHFSRPVPIYTFVKITIDEFYNEETLPTDWRLQMKEAIIEYGNNLPLGKDIILQRWYNPVYSVSGIAKVTIEHGTSDDQNAESPDDPPGWLTDNISVDSTGYVVVSLGEGDKDRIIINEP